jgi:hypothetical protein
MGIATMFVVVVTLFAVLTGGALSPRIRFGMFGRSR